MHTVISERHASELTVSRKIPSLRKIKGKRKNEKIAYLFLLPFFLSFLIFFAFPSVYSLILSFFKYRGYGVAKFVGFKNYLSLLK